MRVHGRAAAGDRRSLSFRHWNLIESTIEGMNSKKALRVHSIIQIRFSCGFRKLQTVKCVLQWVKAAHLY